MDLIECLKDLYQGSSDRVCITDENMHIIWKNSSDLPGYIEPLFFLDGRRQYLQLPMRHEGIYSYKFDEITQCVKIKPLMEGNEIIGYLLNFFNADELCLMSDRSDIKRHRIKANSVISNNTAMILHSLEIAQRNIDLGNEFDFGKLDRDIRKYILKLLASKANYYELGKYNSGDIISDQKNVSYQMALLCDRFEKCLKNTNIFFTKDIEPEVYMDINVDRLWAAVANLLTNAVMYNENDNIKVALRLYTKGQTVVISVKDNAGGIDEDVLKRSLTPFTMHRPVDDHESLGLAVVKKHCEYYGGRLEADIEKGVSTEFKMIYHYDRSRVPDRLSMSEMFPYLSNYDQAGSIFAKAFDLTGNE